MTTKKDFNKDAQQELMERSLTNVRALVDKIEAEEAAQRRTQKWVVVSLIGAVVVLVAAVAIAISKSGQPGKPIPVAPTKAVPAPLPSGGPGPPPPPPKP
jgi:hypothetical protein